MSTDPNEYGVPVIFDVTAHSREDAGEALVQMLAGHNIPGTKAHLDGRGEQVIESWWTLEEIDKGFDRNDNDAGVVLFKEDLDYLFTLLAAVENPLNVMQHKRLLRYLHPHGRVGWLQDEEED